MIIIIFTQNVNINIDFLYTLLYNCCMDGYLSYLSAAVLWDIPCIETVIGYKIQELTNTEITVSKHSSQYYADGKIIHSSELALPDNAVIMRNGRMAASPELLFLEFARKLSIHRLILLGLQLCSHPPGHPSEAITTKQKLELFLAKTAGHWGQRKAIRAVKYVENGSASIMESLAYMILRLPHALGGYGLNGAIFNYEIRLMNEAKVRLGQDRCFVDLYYKQRKIGVEYESYAFHSRPSELGKDAVRSAVLGRKGINVMHLNTIQLFDRDACRDFAYNLAARLGKRIHIRTMKFNEMHTQLRELLPSGKFDT